jgi:uncharacterized membrane protein YdjX (TVP38/TMEM64 family)
VAPRREVTPTGRVEAGSRTASHRRVVLALVAAGALLALARVLDGPALLRGALDGLQGLGGWGPALFVLLYVLATVLFLPGAILTLGAGAAFGVVRGVAVVSVAATLGATAAFLVGRYVARDWVSARIEGRATFRALDEAVAREGWKIVGLMRLSPVVPFNFLNYAFGVTQVSLRDYVLASWVGMLPGTVMYVYLGSVAGSLATVTLGAHGGPARGAAEWGLYGLGLCATVAVTVYVTRLARAALARRLDA